MMVVAVVIFGPQTSFTSTHEDSWQSTEQISKTKFLPFISQIQERPAMNHIQERNITIKRQDDDYSNHGPLNWSMIELITDYTSLTTFYKIEICDGPSLPFQFSTLP